MRRGPLRTTLRRETSDAKDFRRAHGVGGAQPALHFQKWASPPCGSLGLFWNSEDRTGRGKLGCGYSRTVAAAASSILSGAAHERNSLRRRGAVKSANPLLAALLVRITPIGCPTFRLSAANPAHSPSATAALGPRVIDALSITWRLGDRRCGWMQAVFFSSEATVCRRTADPPASVDCHGWMTQKRSLRPYQVVVLPAPKSKLAAGTHSNNWPRIWF